jgi:hypothetical protein
MKEPAQSMTPAQAAAAFFGQSDSDFSQIVDKLTQHDARLRRAFENTRTRYLEDTES